MKTKNLLFLFCLLFGLVSQAQNDVKNKPTPINIQDWKTTPVVSGRIATEEDVKNGSAVYYLKNAGAEHAACTIELPKLAYWHDKANSSQELVIMIQVETAKEGIIVVGYKKLNGESGACLFNELTFLNDAEIEQVIRENK